MMGLEACAAGTRRRPCGKEYTTGRVVEPAGATGGSVGPRLLAAGVPTRPAHGGRRQEMTARRLPLA